MSRFTKGNARRSIIDTAVFRVASQVSTILGYIVLVRAMSEQDFGVFNLLYAFIPVVGTLASLGLEQTLRRYQPEYLRGGLQGRAHWLYRVVASTRLASTIVVLGIVLLCWKWLAPIFGLAPYRQEFLLFSLLLVLHFQNSLLTLSLSSHMLHRYAVGGMALWSFCKLVAYALIAWLGELTVEVAIIADIGAYAVCHAFLRIAHHRYCVPAEPGDSGPVPREEKRRLIRYGLLNNFNESGSLALNSKVDNFYIAAFLGPLSVAIYSFYTRLHEMTRHLLPVRLFENVVSPMMFATDPAEADRRIPRHFTLLLNLNYLLHWPLLAAAFAYHGEIVQVVFAGKYLQYSWLLPMIMAIGSVAVVATPATMVAQYEEKAGTILASKIFAVANIGMLLLLVPLLGIAGAVVSTGTFDAFKNLFIWWRVRRRARWLNAGRALLSAALVWGGAVGVCEGLKVLFPAHPLVHLAAGVVVLGLAMLVYLRTAALSADDRSVILSLAGPRAAPWLRRLFGALPVT